MTYEGARQGPTMTWTNLPDGFTVRVECPRDGRWQGDDVEAVRDILSRGLDRWRLRCLLDQWQLHIACEPPPEPPSTASPKARLTDGDSDD